MSGLEVQAQTSFAAGSFENPARELIPETGFAYAINALLDEDGTVYRRGGSSYKSNTDFTDDLTLLWDGYLSTGNRTVFATDSTFGVLAADDATPVNIGGAGCSRVRPASVKGMLFIPVDGDVGLVTVYAGARKAIYTTGSITTDSTSKVVTGTGTAFSANVEPGTFITHSAQIIGVVDTVDSDTQVTLRDNALSTNSSPTSYTAAATATYSPFGTTDITSVASIYGRLVASTGSDIRFLTPDNPFAVWDPTDYHRLDQGAAVIGMEALRGTLLAFSTQGVFTVSGMANDLTDPQGNIQQRLDQISRDVILTDQRGISGWQGSLIVPATDDVYLVNESAAPQPVSQPIRERYRNYVAQGFGTGHATVLRNHYFLPILDHDVWKDTMIVRLDQGGWTFWDGHGGTSTGFATRNSSGTARSPLLLSANARRVTNLTNAFSPTDSNATDADGTSHQFTLVTRDFTLDGLRRALVKKTRLRYELNGDAGLELDYGTGQVVKGNPLWGAVTWGDFTWGATSVEQFVNITGTAPADNGTTPFVWPVVAGGTGRRPRFARFRIRSTGTPSNVTIRALELMIRPGGRQ